MKLFLAILGCFVIAGLAYAASEYSSHDKQWSWRYKITVEIDTTEGVKSGSAVRQMGNDYRVTFPPEASNYGEVSGEAVVVDLGERGVVFALISDTADSEFYTTFRVPEGAPETPEGYAYYASLPVGTKAALGTDRYIKFVTFTDMDDAKSVELVYDREICAWVKEPQDECNGRKGFYTVANRFEELFGEGVKLKNITLEITDEPVTWGVVDGFLPKTFQTEIKDNWRDLPKELRHRIYYLTRFKQGEWK